MILRSRCRLARHKRFILALCANSSKGTSSGNRVDLRYPRFTSHFTIGSIHTCGVGDGVVPALTMLDKGARKIFEIRLLDDGVVEQRAIWMRALKGKIAGITNWRFPQISQPVGSISGNCIDFQTMTARSKWTA